MNTSPPAAVPPTWLPEGPWRPSPPTDDALTVLGRRAWWSLVGGLLLLALAWLAGAPLFDVDEGAFSEATREMLVSGDWLRTTLNGEARWDKPIGVYWLQAISVSLFGLGEFALRLPSALSGWAWALALVWFAAPRLGRGVALSAGVMLSTSLGVLFIGRAATADALLNLLMTLTALDAWRWLETGRAAPLRRAWVFIGLGLLVKGPVAVVVPGAALLVWLVSWRQLGLLRRGLGAALADWRAWALLLAVALPWYAYILHRFGQEFIDGFLIRHNLARYSSPLEQHGGGVGYYLVVLPLLLLPWAPLLWPVLRRWRAHWADPLRRYLLGWGLFVLAFFSLSGTKLPHYMLYGASPWVLLMALELHRASPALRRVLGLGMLLPLLLVFGSAATLPQWATQIGHPFYRALLSGPAAPVTVLLPGVLAGLLALGLLVAGRRHGADLARASETTGLAVAVALLSAALPWWGQQLQGPIQAAAVAARQRPETAVQWHLHQPSFSVYRERETPRRPPEPGELALIRMDLLPKLQAKLPASTEVVFEQRGLGLVRWGQAGAPAAASASLPSGDLPASGARP